MGKKTNSRYCPFRDDATDILLVVTFLHKVLTYIEYRAVSSVFRTIDPPPPLHPASVPPPPPQKAGGEVDTRRAVGGGGSIFRKTPDIGLASYSTYNPSTPSCLQYTSQILEGFPTFEEEVGG